jgi:hypothetical protein
MLTLFTIPKAFRGPFDQIQRNAIGSWTRLHADCQVILLGNEPGTETLAQDLSLEHVAEVPCSPLGTPLFNGLFQVAERHARHAVMCYVNADIILLPDFAEAVRQVMTGGRPSFVAGQRWDVPVQFPVEFSADWDARLREYARRHGKRHGAGGLDYFVYPKGALGDMPPFAVGRTAYDNWILYHALRCRLRLIDATRRVMAIHQNHDYSHDPGGTKNVWDGPEARRNKELSGGPRYWYNLYNARWLLTHWGLFPACSFRHLKRRLKCPL